MQCWSCNLIYKISECSQHTTLTVEECLKLVKQKRFCFNCLSNSHLIKDCKSKVSCRIDSCNKRYQTLLHLHSDNLKNSLRSYQSHHHITSDNNTETPNSPDKTKATIHTQIRINPHLFTS